MLVAQRLAFVIGTQRGTAELLILVIFAVAGYANGCAGWTAIRHALGPGRHVHCFVVPKSNDQESP